MSEKFSLRIISCDYYQEKPIRGLDETYSKFRSAEIESVPVIRIFGITPAGQKACLHVHGVYPYLSVPYKGQMGDTLTQYIQELASNIDNSINSVGFKGKKQHVYKIEVKKAIPYYGYNEMEQTYLKVLLYNPSVIKKLIELLNGGMIMNTWQQPHEAHIPYILQFFIDYNLFGMNYIHVANVRFRIFPTELNFQPLTSPLIDERHIHEDGLWNFANLPPNMCLGENVKRQSTCELEVDCSSGFILNRLDSTATSGSNPGLAAIWEDEKQRHREIFNNSKITPPVSQDRSDVRKTTSEEYFLSIFQSKMKSIALSQESEEDDSFNQSHCELNKSGVENFQFLELFRNILEAEEADSILSTQISDRNSQILKIDDHGVSGDESDDSLEMSQVFWLEDLVSDEVDEDLEKLPHSSGSSVIQLGQKEAIRVDSRLSNSDHINDEAGCSFWLPQLDGAFDSTDDRGSAESSSLLELAKRRKPPRKYKSLSASSRRLSRTKVLRSDKRPTNEETNSVEDVGTSNRVLRKRNDKPYQSVNEDKNYFNSIDQILEELPPSATNAILSNDVKIPLYVKLKHLKKLGTERIVVEKNKQLQDTQKIVTENILANEESDRKDKGSSRLNEDEGETKPVKRACRRVDAKICSTPIISSNLRLRSRSHLIREEPLLEISKVDDVSQNKEICLINESDGGSLIDNSFKINDKTLNLNLETQIVNESGEDLFPNNTLTKLSPKSQKANILSTPPLANSPTEQPGEFVSFRSRSCSVSSASENDITLCLESSDESFHSDQELSQTTRNLLKFDPDEPSKLNSSSYESNSKSTVVNDDNFTQRTTTLVYSLENQSKPSQQTDTCIIKMDSIDSAVQVQADDIDVIKENQVELETRKCNLNSSVYSFINLDASMSSLEEVISPNYNDNSDFIQEVTVEYEILQAPLPPPRCKVEIGGFDIQKHPDSTSKIDKQGYSLDPNHLEEYQGTFRGALDKIKILSNANPPVNLCENEDIITPLIIPPSFNEVENWCQQLSKPLLDIEKNLKEVIEITNVSKTPISSIETETFVTSLLEPSTPCLPKKTSTQESRKNLRKNNKSKFRNILDDEKESLSPIFFDSDKSSLETILEEPVETKTETTFSNEKPEPKKVLKITPTRNNDTFSVIEGVTQNSSSEFPSMHEKFDQRKTHMEFITVMSLEVHCQTRDSLKPNPKLDEISAVFYCIQNQSPPNPSVPEIIVGAIVVEKQDVKPSATPPCSGGNEGSSKSIFSENSKSSNFKMEIKYGTRDLRLFGCDCLPNNTLNVTTVASEKDLYEELVNLMKKWDPEIIIGYEIEMLSWGYVLERASEVGEELCGALSRIPKSRGVGATRSKSRMSILVEDLDSDNIPDIKVTGRIVLNVWKIMRKEVALTSYTFENAYYHISNKRVPYYDSKTLTEWFCNSKLRWNLLEHYVYRVCGVIELMDHFNIVGRTSELARIFGIQFFEVFSRGSQFRVESMMLRMVKAANYVAVSPSIQQRAHSRAPESLPLILEPESKFYTDPVLVLDFQSLYPSIIIAYNYCYSTCLGRVEYLGLNDPFEFGCTSLSIPLEVQKKLEKDVTICPLGIVFVKPKIRRGILPKMLQEILETRIMVKKSMKENKGNKSVVKLLDARQLGLKLIANVTFGYTAANYSGRMPCVEVADSILSKSRETLQNAITFVENNSKWGAHVVYGDTDSMFVRLPGRTKEQAFKIGEEIAEAVTALNPNPIKLKFEKVYLPCVLQTKKRYVGYMYETVDQKEPVFDAKGIETVRRDSCPAVGKILEKSLRLLFSNRDLYPVKMYIQRQFQKLLSDRTNIQELIFAKEFRGINGYRAGAHYVPPLTIARRLVHLDPRAEPRVGERVPYVIVYGEPGLPLIKLVRQPQELLNDDSLRINSQYYITRVIIPPLERVFCLLGFTVTSWLNELPRTLFTNKDFGALATNKTSLPQYFTRVNCVICERPSDKGFCFSCKKDSQRAVVLLEARMNDWETSLVQLTQICQSCTGLSSPGNSCQSLDCPVLFRLAQAKKDITQRPFLREKIDICLNDSCTI